MATSYNLPNGPCNSKNNISLDQIINDDNLRHNHTNTIKSTSIINSNTSFTSNSTKIKTINSSAYTCTNKMKTSNQVAKDAFSSNQPIILNINKPCLQSSNKIKSDESHHTNDFLNDNYKSLCIQNLSNNSNFGNNNTVIRNSNDIINTINNSQMRDSDNIPTNNIIRRIQINKIDNQESLLKLERNYSYIEAIKDEKYRNVNTVKIQNKNNNQNLDCRNNNEPHVPNEDNKDYFLNDFSLNVNTVNQNSSILIKNNNLNIVTTPNESKKTVITLPIKSTSPSSNSSTSSNESTNKQDSLNKLYSNLSKSKSQSNIINLFKTTFSPFTIRRWRSKSRDKICNNFDLKNDVKDVLGKKENTKNLNCKAVKVKNTIKNNHDIDGQIKSLNKADQIADYTKNQSMNKNRKPNTNTMITNDEEKSNNVRDSVEKSNKFVSSATNSINNMINPISSSSTSSTVSSSSSSSLFSSINTNNLSEPANLSLKILQNNLNRTSNNIKNVAPIKIHTNQVSIISSSTTIVRQNNNNNQLISNNIFKNDLESTNSDTKSIKDYPILNKETYNTHSITKKFTKEHEKCSNVHDNEINNKKDSNSPQSERQLSYLKLTCLVNGYDSFKCKKFDNISKNSTNSSSISNSITELNENSGPNKINTSKNNSERSSDHNDLENDSLKLDDLLIKSAKVLNDSNRYYDIKKKMNNFGSSNLPYTLSVKSSKKFDEGINYFNLKNSNLQELNSISHNSQTIEARESTHDESNLINTSIDNDKKDEKIKIDNATISNELIANIKPMETDNTQINAQDTVLTIEEQECKSNVSIDQQEKIDNNQILTKEVNNSIVKVIIKCIFSYK